MVELSELVDEEFQDLVSLGKTEITEEIIDEFIDNGLNEDEAQSDTIQFIAEIIAQREIDIKLQLLFYFQETFPTRAQLRSSVVEGFLQQGFEPTRRTSASVELKFHLGFDFGQGLQGPVSSGDDVSVPVDDASQFDVGRLVRFQDSQSFEDTTIQNLDEPSNTVVVDLDNDYSPDRGAEIQQYSVNNTDVFIPKNFPVENSDAEVTVYTSEDVVIPSGQETVIVEAFEGTLQETTIQSQGDENLQIDIPSSVVAEDSITVEVGGTEWEEINSLREAIRGSDQFESYELESRPDESLRVLFGDGRQGAIPTAGESVRVEWRDTEGPLRITTSNSFTDPLQSAEDVAGNTVPVSVTNDGNILSGGSDAMSVREMKILGPDVFQTGDRAVSRRDHIAISREFPSVLLANAIGERNADPGDPNWARRVDLYVIRERDADGTPLPVTNEWAYGEGGSPENPESGSFAGNLLDLGVMTNLRNVYEAGLVWFYLQSTVGISPSSEPSVVRSEITNQFDDFLLLENNPDRNVGDPIRQSVVADLVDDVGSVRYHYTDLIQFAQAPFTATNQTFGFDDFGTPTVRYSLQPPFQPESIELVDLDRNVIARDDGEGSMIPTSFGNSVDFLGGTVDYREDPEDWELSVEWGTAPNEVLRFQAQNDDPRDQEGNQRGDVLVSPKQFPIYRSPLTEFQFELDR